MKIVKINTSNNIDIEFQDEHHYIKQNTTYSNFKIGSISNPYFPTVCGVGYLGVGRFATNNNCVEYVTWKDMLERCYSEKDRLDHKSYFGISEVCNDWLDYQNFGEWYELNKYEVNERLHLDKDILIPGNTLYAPDRCLLIPQRINELFTCKVNGNGLPVGINKTDSGRYRVQYNEKGLGTFDTLEEAFEKYAQRKEEVIKEVADEYINIIPKKAYDAIYRFKVEMKNDKNVAA